MHHDSQLWHCVATRCHLAVVGPRGAGVGSLSDRVSTCCTVSTQLKHSIHSCLVQPYNMYAFVCTIVPNGFVHVHTWSEPERLYMCQDSSHLLLSDCAGISCHGGLRARTDTLSSSKSRTLPWPEPQQEYASIPSWPSSSEQQHTQRRAGRRPWRHRPCTWGA